MSTRKLIVAALVCGLAILLAGGVFLVNLAANRDELTVPEVLAVGAPAAVGGGDVAVVGSGRQGDTVVVHVRFRGADGVEDAGDGWALVEGSVRPRVPVPVDAGGACPGQVVPPGETLECALAFAAGASGATSYVEYAQGDERARWRLDG